MLPHERLPLFVRAVLAEEDFLPFPAKHLLGYQIDAGHLGWRRVDVPGRRQMGTNRGTRLCIEEIDIVAMLPDSGEYPLVLQQQPIATV